ncbi:hypothetical protein IAU59_004605 [Kwoniella sp. CBS 9459]
MNEPYTSHDPEMGTSRADPSRNSSTTCFTRESATDTEDSPAEGITIAETASGSSQAPQSRSTIALWSIDEPYTVKRRWGRPWGYPNEIVAIHSFKPEGPNRLSDVIITIRKSLNAAIEEVCERKNGTGVGSGREVADVLEEMLSGRLREDPTSYRWTAVRASPQELRPCVHDARDGAYDRNNVLFCATDGSVAEADSLRERTAISEIGIIRPWPCNSTRTQTALSQVHHNLFSKVGSEWQSYQPPFFAIKRMADDEGVPTILLSRDSFQKIPGLETCELGTDLRFDEAKDNASESATMVDRDTAENPRT